MSSVSNLWSKFSFVSSLHLNLEVFGFRYANELLLPSGVQGRVSSKAVYRTVLPGMAANEV